MKKKISALRIAIGLCLLAVLVVAPLTAPVQSFLSIPNTMTLFSNNDPADALPAFGDGQAVKAIDQDAFRGQSADKQELIYTVGSIPIKKVSVDVLPDLRIVPGGHSVGVKLHTLGVLVVGHHQVRTPDATVSPGEEAAIHTGDVLLEINDQEIRKMEEVAPLIEQAGKDGKSVRIKVKRGSETMTTKLSPALDAKDKQYRMGLYIRDSAAGIGTMTFYDPVSKNYGALGHVISDMDTQKPIEIHDGTIVRSNVTSIQKGNNGQPGEKLAEFSMNRNHIGTITKNSPFGIFGKLESDMRQTEETKALPIALSDEVKKGPAVIRTVLEGEKIEEFDVEIVNSVPQDHPATKGMIIKVTDKRLLAKTGGIVQGMSGSPIIQDGKLIGAVTHVFVNDSTSGYGVHIEWMLQEAGIDIYKSDKKAS
ncbi:stage IV sporulation protein B [Terribacillus aidingensis]|uniref:Stage IV sporulation protein B n=1 Tax=Terribacillus aidingensis TaxID=586416 RepID=A0A285NN55_9BACI|nr:SpoIVB peptidase [Terribacillus aidingensis]SNZ10658.1 stage IV sporulation protein B [Terribacillus aidingensis]